jgi:hypothetical protein
MNTVSHRLRAVVSVGCLVVGLTFVSTALAAQNQQCKGYCSAFTCKPAYGQLCCCCKNPVTLLYECVSKKPDECTPQNSCQG